MASSGGGDVASVGLKGTKVSGSTKTSPNCILRQEWKFSVSLGHQWHIFSWLPHALLLSLGLMCGAQQGDLGWHWGISWHFHNSALQRGCKAGALSRILLWLASSEPGFIPGCKTWMSLRNPISPEQFLSSPPAPPTLLGPHQG